MFFVFLVLGSVAVMGQDRVPEPDRLQVQVMGGYQQENLRWSIAGTSSGRNPNVYSELKWHGVGGLSTGAALSWEVWRRLVVFAEGSRMFTSSGTVSDTDYGGDDRTDPVYGRSFESHKGYAYANFLGLGYRFLIGSRLQLTPAVGYEWSGQRLSIEDAAEFLNSYYRTWWKGLVVRGSGELRLDGKWGLLFSGVYHQANYRADADWNLIQAFSHPVSFSHRADGYGLEGRLGVKYVAGRHVAVVVAGDYFNWRTGKGVDELYMTSGQTSQTQLNEVVRMGFGVNVGVRLGW
jgi:outer membrane protease